MPEGGIAEIKAAVDELATTTTKAVAKLAADFEAERKRMDGIEKKLGRPGGPGNPAEGNLEAERKALGKLLRTGDDTELKTLQVGVDPDGGYMVLPQISAGFTKRIYDMSPMRRLARSEIVNVGDSFEEPVDLGENGATWVSETASPPATSTPQLGKLSVPLHEIYALQPVTQRLLDDSAFDIGAWVEGKIGDKFGRTEATAFVTGTGVGRPRGFMTYDTATTDDFTRAWGALQYKVSGSASVISDTDGGANGIVDLYWSLRAAYRANGTWLMASSTANALDKLKDGNDNYIWRNGMTAGASPALLGRPVEFCEDMPTISAGTFPVAFGDFKTGYLVIDRPGLKMLRDPYTSKPFVHFYSYRRVGGGVANFDAIKLLKISA